MRGEKPARVALVIEDLEEHVVGAYRKRRATDREVPSHFVNAGAVETKRDDPSDADEVSPYMASHDQANGVRRTDCH